MYHDTHLRQSRRWVSWYTPTAEVSIYFTPRSWVTRSRSWVTRSRSWVFVKTHDLIIRFNIKIVSFRENSRSCSVSHDHDHELNCGEWCNSRYPTLHKWNMEIAFEGGSVFWETYTMRVQTELCIVSNNTLFWERYFHISSDLNGVSILHNKPKYRNNS